VQLQRILAGTGESWILIKIKKGNFSHLREFMEFIRVLRIVVWRTVRGA